MSMYPLVEYYQPTFYWLHETQYDIIQRALLKEPFALRRQFFSKFVPGTELSGIPGHAELRSFLDILDKKLSEILGNHTVLFWLHLYRRISPKLHPDHSGRTDNMTTALVRDIVECAISKYGLLSDLGDIRRASLVPGDQILGGYFLRRLKALVRNRSLRERTIRVLRASDQFVLRTFKIKDLIAIYAIEGLAYEYWLTTARLRSIGKGDIYTVTSDLDLRFARDPDLGFLFTSFDKRIDEIKLMPVDIGTVVPAVIAQKSGGISEIFAPRYNVSGDRAQTLLASLNLAEGAEDAVLNFIPSVISIESYLASHDYLASQFTVQRGYSLRNLLRVVAALSWRIFFPETALTRQLEGQTSSIQLAILNALKRGYAVVYSEADSISRSVLWYLKEFGKLDVTTLEDVQSELSVILADLTLDSSAKQVRVSPWSRGPRYVLIPSSGAMVIDGQGMVSLLRTLFVGLRDSEQSRGVSFEASVRSELEAAGVELIQRRFTFATGDRETDAAVRVGSTLWLVEAHSMWRPLTYEIGDINVIKTRTERFQDKMAQVASIRSELERAPTGVNYDVSWASKIEHCVVSPFVEWVWARDPSLWVDDDTPRLLSLSELTVVLRGSSS
jgi:hypothetical protein